MAFLKRTQSAPAYDAGAQVARLYDEHARMVLGVCRVLLRDPHDAEDAAQQTFLSAHRGLLAGNEPRDPAAWLAAIARNECRARVRQRMTTPTTSELPEELPGLAGVDDVAALNDEMRDLRNALAALPERQRQALVLREFFGLRQDELAAALDVAEPTVESMLWRARKSLEKTRVAPNFGLAILVVPNTLREQLARLIPGFADGANVAAGGAGIGVGAKVAATLLAAAAATSGALTGDRPQSRALPAAADDDVAVVALERSVEDRTLDDSRGRGGGDDARDSELDDNSGHGSQSSGKGSGSDDDRSVSVDNSGSGSSNSGSGSDDSDARADNSGSGSDDEGAGTLVSGNSGSGSSGSGSSLSGSSGFDNSGSDNSGSGSSLSGSSGSDSSGSGSSFSGSSGSGSSGSGSSGSGGSSGGSESDNSGSGSSGSDD